MKELCAVINMRYHVWPVNYTKCTLNDGVALYQGIKEVYNPSKELTWVIWFSI